MTRHAAPLITLTTDFGVRDTYVGVMKGVILGITPEARIVDLTHEVSPQNLLEAGARLEAVLPYFPPGTIHVVVVDPGVGTDRAVIIARTEANLIVAPDNGVLTLPLATQPAIESVKLTEAAGPYLRHPVSCTFHGRDVFAPVAAHLARGCPPASFGLECPATDLVKLALPEAELERTNDTVQARATVLYEDRFGNLITSLSPDDLAGLTARQFGSVIAPMSSNEMSGFAASPGSRDLPHDEVEISVGSMRWQGIVPTFGAVPEGAPLAYWGSSGRLEIAVRNGNAGQIMGVSSGDAIFLRWKVNGSSI